MPDGDPVGSYPTGSPVPEAVHIRGGAARAGAGPAADADDQILEQIEVAA